MSLAPVIDTVLDRSVIGGYGRPGLALRRRLPGWPADPPRMDGRVVVVTGAATGIGRAAAAGFLRLGATVIAVGRSAERANEAAAGLRRLVPGGDVRPAGCDVSSLGSIADLAARLTDEHERLDVLVNNAGVMPDKREESADGIELTFATHVVGPFLLTDRLAGLLRAGAPGRVINVVSGGMYGQSLHADDLQLRHGGYTPKRAYARAKRAQMTITEQWGERLRGTGVVVHAMHPGWVDTEGVRRWMPAFRTLTLPILRDPDEGADTVVWLGAADQPLGSTGQLWHDRRVRPTHYALGARPDDQAARHALWRACVELTGTHR